MAVIVDEMQVDTQPPEQRKRGGEGGGGGDGSSGEQQPPKPEEIERAMRWQAERQGRVWAH